VETFGAKVIQITRCGDAILTMQLERPDGYGFRSGQWFRLYLDTPQGEEVRTFSHASTGQDHWIELTTRLSSSGFKQALAITEVGRVLRVSGPGGRLALPSDAQKLAFLVGGVGITPVRSLLRDAQQAGRKFTEAVVLYGNRDASCEPYLDELLAMRDIGVEVVRVLEHPPQGWTGERGFITAQIVRGHVDAPDGRPFVVAGPPVMVETMALVLDEIGVDTSQRIVEAFGSSSKTAQ